MVTKGNQFQPLPVVNSDGHEGQSVPTSIGGKLRCSWRIFSSYLYRL